MSNGKKIKKTKVLSDSLSVIKRILSPRKGKEQEHDWLDIHAAMNHVIATRTNETEAILDRLLNFKGDIRLSPQSDQPGAMPPRETLQFIAIRTLVDWRGAGYLQALKKLKAQKVSIALDRILHLYIQKLEKGAH